MQTDFVWRQMPPPVENLKYTFAWRDGVEYHITYDPASLNLAIDKVIRVNNEIVLFLFDNVLYRGSIQEDSLGSLLEKFGYSTNRFQYDWKDYQSPYVTYEKSVKAEVFQLLLTAQKGAAFVYKLGDNTLCLSVLVPFPSKEVDGWKYIKNLNIDMDGETFENRLLEVEKTLKFWDVFPIKELPV